MTYQEFLESLLSPCTSILSWFGTLLNYLFTNYIIITIFGLNLFFFLVYFTFKFLYNLKTRKDKESNKYN